MTDIVGTADTHTEKLGQVGCPSSDGGDNYTRSQNLSMLVMHSTGLGVSSLPQEVSLGEWSQVAVGEWCWGC